MKSVGDFTWWELLLTVWFIAYLSKLTLLVGQWEGHSAIKTCAIYPQVVSGGGRCKQATPENTC